MKKMNLLLLSFLIGFAVQAHASNYKIDPQHSTVSFKIRHLFSWVQGSFDKFEGDFTYDPQDPESWMVTASIDPASINTKVDQRDTHLRSKDFFDVEAYPSMSFESTQVMDITPTSAKIYGNLKIHGVEKLVVLDLEIHGEGQDPWGNVLAGFTATTKLNRRDFGLIWNQVVETGQVLVGEEVLITIDIEGIKGA